MDLASRLRARNRKRYPVDLQAALGLPDPAPCFVQIALTGEDDTAMVRGHAYVERLIKSLGPEAAAAVRADADLIGDAKSLEALALAFRMEDGSPVFPDAEFIRGHLSTDEAAALVNALAEWRRVDAHAPLPDDTGVEAVLGLLAGMAERGHENPGVALDRYPREVVTFMLVEAAVRLKRVRAVE